MSLQRRLNLWNAVPLVAILAGGACSVLFWLRRESLWEDELIAITHTLVAFPYFFVEILRNDIHPFFYFLFLKFWAGFGIGSDSWVLASSLISSFASMAVIGWIAARIHGRQAALWVVALYCLLPTSVAAGGNLRMYGLMPGIAICCWYANRQYLLAGRRLWLTGLFVFQFLQAYIHAIGFFFIPFFALAALAEQWQHTDSRRRSIWLWTQVLSLLTMLPVVGSALIRGTEPLPAPSFLSLLKFPPHLFTGGQVAGLPNSFVEGAIIFTILLGFALASKKGKIPVLIIFCGGLLTSILISFAGKPMFKPPVFAANLVPFLAFGAGAAISACTGLLIRSFLFVFVLALMVTTCIWANQKNMPENYKPLAQYLQSNVKTGDVVVAPNPSVYWGVVRYAVAPDWGDPLTTRPMQSNAAWTALEQKLGPLWVARLRLLAKTDYIEKDGVRYVVGGDAHAEFVKGGRVWLVHRNRYKETVRVGQPMAVEDLRWYGEELSLTVLSAHSDGKTSFENPQK